MTVMCSALTGMEASGKMLRLEETEMVILLSWHLLDSVRAESTAYGKEKTTASTPHGGMALSGEMISSEETVMCTPREYTPLLDSKMEELMYFGLETMLVSGIPTGMEASGKMPSLEAMV